MEETFVMTESYPERAGSESRAAHRAWLEALTAIPTAAGCEWRVVSWIERWVGERGDLELRRDGAGNLVIERGDAPGAEAQRPLFITAHLDHPAFVVEGFVGPGTVRLSFRGGVRDPYFVDAPIRIVTREDREIPAVLIEARGEEKPFKHYLAELTGDAGGGEEDAESLGIAVGDVARWDLPDPEVIDGVLHTHACDDLAGVAAALAALDALRGEAGAAHVRLLFTRAEEIGFVGATAAMHAVTVPRESRLVLLENSRSFAESPIGGGPIVRVGDRMSTFNPGLTAGFAKIAEGLVEASKGTGREFRWQRKLMPGGACEASVYQAYGYEATCLCLPLGNYHNMADLAGVESGDADAVAGARCGREHIALEDFHALVDLLVAAGTGLAEVAPITDLIERLYEERKFVLG